MAAKTNKAVEKRKPSKRERRMKIIIYVMVILMVISTFTAGLAMFI